ncbi:MAG: hypothetical protein QMC58_04430 [Candidatus Poseidoniaceae archaeon]|jgi:hypothetical protein|tara:strand:+ start:91 stop:807 length:717 start_codon:yes stop_codon:yes gene_type:complete
MEDLVETLAIGLLVSVILIVISWWFWKRYDEPSEAQIEREESIAKKEKETQMWRAVESQMNQEKAALEEQALYERRKAEERERALPPPTGEVSNAFAAFDMERQTPVKSFTEQHDTAPSAEAALIGHEMEPEANDEDVLAVEELVEVRQDKGFVFEQQETVPESTPEPVPETVPESTPEVAINETSDEAEVSIPSAPDLDMLSHISPESTSEPEWSLEEEEPPLETDWSDNWFNLSYD